MNLQPTLFDGVRLTAEQSIELTAQSLSIYGAQHDDWAIAWSGGKDSTTLLTLVVYLIDSDRVPHPKTLTVFYADTRMELPPLSISAQQIIRQLHGRGIDVRTVMAPMDQRYFVYMLGRGVPPPNNNTLRWCTEQIKVKPMEAGLHQRVAEIGRPDQKLLMLIGVRIGESAARDARIALACSRNGSECGQGWYQKDLPDAICDKLSPILHWRTCLVWDWLSESCGHKHGFQTHLLAQAYGLAPDTHPDEINARTGCLGCPLANNDTALDAVIRLPEWRYLTPLKRLRPIYRELREARNRLRMPPGERRKDGTLIKNQNRMGPLTMEARRWALEQILAVQDECNQWRHACGCGLPAVDILNAEEVSRIRELMDANTWPEKWSGEEPVADLPYESMGTDGTRQMLLEGLGEA